MIIKVLGKRGSGKSLICMIYALYNSSYIYNYANYHLKSKTYRPLTLLQLLDLPNKCNVLIDEGYTWLESRTSMKYINLFLSYIMFQLRKSRRNIYITAQDDSTIDIRFREHWDYKIDCERVDNGLPKPCWDFRYTITRNDDLATTTMRFSYFDMYPYFHLFDTYEIVEPTSKSRIELELLKTEPKQFFDKANQIFDIVKTSTIKYSKEAIKYSLILNNFDPAWTDIIHLIANNSIKR